MSKQANKMPKVDIKMYVRIVAAVFLISSGTAFSMVMLRIVKPNLFYEKALQGRDRILHFFISGMMAATSVIGFINSLIVLNRRSDQNLGWNITIWLLVDSIFETTRVVYVFVCEVILDCSGSMQLYETLVSGVQYLLDSCLYCQMILRH